MDDNDIVVLEPPEKKRNVTNSAFSIAPPSVIARWTRPSVVQNQWRAVDYPHAHAHTYTHTTNTQAQLMISDVKSLSPSRIQTNAININPIRKQPTVRSVSYPHRKYPIITEVKSLSPIKNQTNNNGQAAAPYRRSPPVFNDGNYLTPIKREKKKLTESEPLCITLDDDCTTPTINMSSQPPSGQQCHNKTIEIPDSAESETIEAPDSAESATIEVPDSAESKTIAEPDCDERKSALDQVRPTQESENNSCIPPHKPRQEVKCGAAHSSKKRKLGQEAGSSTHLSIEDFIKACEDMDSSDDMKTIIEKKIRKHYNGAERSFTASSSFQKLLKEQLEKLKLQPKDLFVHIHELVNELKARKASANLQEPPAKKRKTGPESSSAVDYEAVEEKRTEMKIKKLSSTLSKLQKMIAHLETQEVSWDEDADSSYIMLQRYKDRAVKVFDKLCDYTQESKSAGKIVKIAFTGSEISKVNKCIEQFVNRTGQFPDYLDILDVIKKANSEDNLKLTEEKIEEIAKKAFTDVGEELQRQRRHGVAESLFSFIESKDVDPADEDSDLKEKLLENKKHWDKINEVIDDFVSRSNEKKETQSDEEKGSDEEDEDEDEDDEDDAEDEGEIPELLNLSDPDSDDDKGSSSKSASDEAVSSRAESPSSKAEGDDLRPTSPNGNPVGSSSSPTPVNENVADCAETPDGPSAAKGEIQQNKEA